MINKPRCRIILIFSFVKYAFNNFLNRVFVRWDVGVSILFMEFIGMCKILLGLHISKYKSFSVSTNTPFPCTCLNPRDSCPKKFALPKAPNIFSSLNFSITSLIRCSNLLPIPSENFFKIKTYNLFSLHRIKIL